MEVGYVTRADQRKYCWIRQQRYMLAVHRFIYYELSESILDDLQYDYLEKRLEVVEVRNPKVSDAVTKEGYLSPRDYADSLMHPSIEWRARRMVKRWELNDRHLLDDIPYMSSEINRNRLYWEACRHIVKYPI